MARGNDSFKGGLIVFGLTALVFLSSCSVLELTAPDFFCSVSGQNGKYCNITLLLFVIAAIFLVLFCIGSLLWAAFSRYDKLSNEED